MDSAVATKDPADLTSIPLACSRIARRGSLPHSCTSSPSAPVSQIA